MEEYGATRSSRKELPLGGQLLDKVLDSIFAEKRVIADEGSVEFSDFFVFHEGVFGDVLEALLGGGCDLEHLLIIIF